MKVLYFCTGYIIFSLIGYHEAVRIVRIRQPPLMKSQSTDITTSWDLPVGSTITVECEKPSQTLTYETHRWAENERFGGGRFVHNSSANAWTLSDLQSSDTGWLVCFNNGSVGSGSNNENTTVELADVESTQNSSLYIFVNSPDSLDMFVPLEYLVFYKLFFGAYFPCLPTNSSTEVTLILGPDQTNQLTELVKGIDYIFDKQEGVKLLQIPSEESFYTCQYTNGGDTVSHSYYFYIVDLAALPHPILSPTTQRTHYLVGEDLTMVCYILFDDIESIVYKYPASNCSYDVIDDLGCDKLKTKGRITMTPLTKVSPTNVTSNITIRDLQLNDSGLYTCSYKIYQDTEYRRQGSLEIHVVDRQLTSVTAEETTLVGVNTDESLTLTAEVESLRQPNIRWSFESEDLQVDGKYNMSTKQTDNTWFDVKLVIYNPSIADQGTYHLTASLGSEDLSLDFFIQVNIAPKLSLLYSYHNHTIPVSSSGQTVYFQPSQVLTTTCESTEGLPQPDITLYWQDCNYRTLCAIDESKWSLLPNELGETLNTHKNQPYIHSVTENSKILRLTTQKSGWLKCAGSNIVSEVNRILRVGISALPEEFSGVGFPVTTTKQASQLVENDVIVLPCFVSKLSCTKNMIQIIRSSDEVYTKNSPNILRWDSKDEAYMLSIALNVTLDMDGYKYACRCKGGRQGPIATLNVQKFVYPYWQKHLNSIVEIASGQTYTMICRAGGTPLPTTTWYRDGKLLKETGTTLISKDKQNLTLIRVTSADSGEYWCRAKVSGRSDGYIQSSSTLIVTDKSKFSTLSDQLPLIIVIILVACLTAFIVSFCIVRKYCRRKYVPHILLLPSKENINPDLPLDEQTDALPYDRKWEFPVRDLTLGPLLGQGAFGKVLKAEAKNIERRRFVSTVAVKTVKDARDAKQMKSLISELKILIHIGQHLNIVNLLGACTKDINKGQLLVIVEYCEYGNLRSYLLENKSRIVSSLQSPEAKFKRSVIKPSEEKNYINESVSTFQPITVADLFSWSYQIARGMEYLASINYIHRDLAARNVLLADNNIVKICDFGLSKDVYKYQEYHKQSQGPLPIKWMALESLTHKVFNVRTDVWAYGVTVWELFSLAATPYPGWEIDDAFIKRLLDGYRMSRPSLCPMTIYKNVLCKCWNANPMKRPNFATLAEVMSEKMDKSLVEHLKTLERPFLAKKDCGRQKSSAASSGKTVDIDVYNPMYREIKERYAASQQSCSTDHSKMASEFVTSSAQTKVVGPLVHQNTKLPTEGQNLPKFTKRKNSAHTTNKNSPNSANLSSPPSYCCVVDEREDNSAFEHLLANEDCSSTLDSSNHGNLPKNTESGSGEHDSHETRRGVSTVPPLCLLPRTSGSSVETCLVSDLSPNDKNVSMNNNVFSVAYDTCL